ncbi:MAG: tetratricopeptide repeat protein [Thermogutta sp.]|nr:tetratricopeptide repeat protein [Thermogutta sp.]
MIARLVAAFAPNGPEAEALNGNHPTKTVLQVSYESVNTSGNTASGGFVSPQLASELFGRGSHFFWEGNYAQALELFDMGLGINPDDARLWYFKGFSEMALNRMDDAERSIVTAIVLHEKSSNTREIAQSLERVQGRFRAVIEKLRPKAALALRTTRVTGPKAATLPPVASDARPIR